MSELDQLEFIGGCLAPRSHGHGAVRRRAQVMYDAQGNRATLADEILAYDGQATRYKILGAVIQDGNGEAQLKWYASSIRSSARA